MITGSIRNSSRYLGPNLYLDKAFDFILKTNFSKLSPGKIEIDDEMYGIIIRPGTCVNTNSKLEVHRKYLDLHYVITGSEVFGCMNIDECLEPEGVFNEREDFQLFQDITFNKLVLNAGHFVVFYPEDAHVPSLSTRELAKIVIKVKLKTV